MDPEQRLTLGYLHAHPLEAAKQFESWNPQDVATLLEPYPAEDIAFVLEHVQAAQAAAVLQRLPEDMAVKVITALPTAMGMGVLRVLEPKVQEALFARLDQTVGPSLRLSILYPDGTAASLADPRVLTLPPDTSVAAALDRIKQERRHATYYHYVVERDGTLAGLVTTKELLGADPTQLVASVMNDQVVTLAAEATEEELLQHRHWRLYHTMPVVDRNHRFLGALRYRTLRRIEENSTAKPTTSPLPQALFQLWEAYALIGLHVMTDLAQVLGPARVGTGHGRHEQEADADGTPSPAP